MQIGALELIASQLPFEHATQAVPAALQSGVFALIALQSAFEHATHAPAPLQMGVAAFCATQFALLHASQAPVAVLQMSLAASPLQSALSAAALPPAVHASQVPAGLLVQIGVVELSALQLASEHATHAVPAASQSGVFALSAMQFAFEHASQAPAPVQMGVDELCAKQLALLHAWQAPVVRVQISLAANPLQSVLSAAALPPAVHVSQLPVGPFVPPEQIGASTFSAWQLVSEHATHPVPAASQIGVFALAAAQFAFEHASHVPVGGFEQIGVLVLIASQAAFEQATHAVPAASQSGVLVLIAWQFEFVHASQVPDAPPAQIGVAELSASQAAFEQATHAVPAASQSGAFGLIAAQFAFEHASQTPAPLQTGVDELCAKQLALLHASQAPVVVLQMSLAASPWQSVLSAAALPPAVHASQVPVGALVQIGVAALAALQLASEHATHAVPAALQSGKFALIAAQFAFEHASQAPAPVQRGVAELCAKQLALLHPSQAPEARLQISLATSPLQSTLSADALPPAVHASQVPVGALEQIGALVFTALQLASEQATHPVPAASQIGALPFSAAQFGFVHASQVLLGPQSGVLALWSVLQLALLHATQAPELRLQMSPVTSELQSASSANVLPPAVHPSQVPVGPLAPPEQIGVFALLAAQLTSEHASQCPFEALQTGVLPVQLDAPEVVHGTHVSLVLQTGSAGLVQADTSEAVQPTHFPAFESAVRSHTFGEHCVSLEQATQVSLPLQIGVLPLQFAFVVHWTQTPVPVLQTGVAPPHCAFVVHPPQTWVVVLQTGKETVQSLVSRQPTQL